MNSRFILEMWVVCKEKNHDLVNNVPEVLISKTLNV